MMGVRSRGQTGNRLPYRPIRSVTPMGLARTTTMFSHELERSGRPCADPVWLRFINVLKFTEALVPSDGARLALAKK